MKTSRSNVSAALFNLWSTLTWTPIGASSPIGFATSGRRVRIWSNVDPGAQPAGFQQKIDEDAVQDQAYGATKYVLNYRLWLYLRGDASEDPTTTNEDLYDPLLDALDTAINGSVQPPFFAAQTLGGKVAHTWINGKTLIDPGVNDQQIVIVVPVSVLAAL